MLKFPTWHDLTTDKVDHELVRHKEATTRLRSILDRRLDDGDAPSLNGKRLNRRKRDADTERDQKQQSGES
jgi:hypothetical protein